MRTLFNVKFNWVVYFFILIVIRITFVDLSWFSFFALMITIHQFILLFNSIGFLIPVRYLFGAFMCLQMLLGPVLAYNGLDQFQKGYYKMQVPEAEYFAYVLPAVICFIIGLHIRSANLQGEYINQRRITEFTNEHPTIPYIFIIVGFTASIVSTFVSSDIGFMFYLLGSFKFIGLFMIILSNKGMKPLHLALVYGSIIISSINQGMFHDLLTWLIFLGAVFAIKYKPSINIKLIFAISFIALAITIQQVKGDYREATWKNGEEAGVDAMEKVLRDKQEKKTLFSYDNLVASNIRINQGAIITNIMRNIPAKLPYSNGEEMMQIIEAAVLPRILAPNKLNAGDRELFMKYSGMRIAQGTSMGLSSVGDAYINFGIFGGSVFMFVLGFLYSELLKAFYRYSKTYPILLLFISLVVYYPIRPDCELQTILGHMVKSCFLLIGVFQVWKYTFLMRPSNKIAQVSP